MKPMKKCVYIGLPILGVLFYFAYLQHSAIDVVYSDYIRLINSYLPDVWNPEKFFVPDLLTRIPISYLGRIINVYLFDYSVTFDRILSVVWFGVSTGLVGVYCMNHKVGLGWYTAIMVFMFSLNKWEMLYNGTGWCHFMAFACFFYHYLVLDRVYQNKAKKGDYVKLIILPFFTTIGVAGPYCASYTAVVFISYGFIMIQNWVAVQGDDKKWNAARMIFGGERCKLTNRQIIILVIAVLIPFFAFLWSNAQAEYIYVDAPASLIGSLLEQIKFFIKFFLKSFTTMIFGVEYINRHLSFVPKKVWYVVGLIVFSSYFLALWINFRYEIYKTTIFPLMLLAGGGINHVLVLMNRWIFANDSYGMSSRYALQYQIGILGVLLTFALLYRKQTENRECEARGKTGLRVAVLAISAMFVLGNVETTREEYDFGQHRKNHNVNVREILLDFENHEEEALSGLLEYGKEGRKDALRILKENGWNIFRDEKINDLQIENLEGKP